VCRRQSSSTGSAAASQKPEVPSVLLKEGSRAGKNSKTDGSLRSLDPHEEYKRRFTQLEGIGQQKELYPRLKAESGHNDSPAHFKHSFDSLKDGEKRHDVKVTVCGKVRASRSSSSKLLFLDIWDNEEKVQGVCDWQSLEAAGIVKEQFSSFRKSINKGDWFSITGYPYRTNAGELSVFVTQLPQLLAPNLHQLPESVEDENTLARNKHLHLIIDRKARETLRVRHVVETSIMSFLHDRDFLRVQTPLLGHGAGGATARPFITTATDFQDQKLELRIAPELFLKRLVVGSMGRVYEMGPAFRNEGIDATHNPEFTICEFYQPFASLADLMHTTEQLFAHLLRSISSRLMKDQGSPVLGDKEEGMQEDDVTGPYNVLEFIPTLESIISKRLDSAGWRIPDLSLPKASQELQQLFERLGARLPTNPTLPRLLDELSSLYIEPLCVKPTWITHHPVALSPLAKGFTDEMSGQQIAARAELFIEGKEYVNCYEEENDPFVQRKKFEMQRSFRSEDDAEISDRIDENYLECLEWGLPPTGGWGCGVDRLVMLFSGTKRIQDVLSFGTLRNVVSMGKEWRR